MALKKLHAVEGTPEEREKIVVRWGDMQEQPLSGREIRDFERVQAVTFMALQRAMNSGPGDMPWDTLLALVWILQRRKEPTLSFDDVLDLRIDQWEFEDAAIVDVDPIAEPSADIATGS